MKHSNGNGKNYIKISKRLMQIAQLAADGNSAGQISDKLGIKKETASARLSDIKRKLGVEGAVSEGAGRVMLKRKLRDVITPGDEFSLRLAFNAKNAPSLMKIFENLRPKQKQITLLLAEGNTVKQIANMLGMTTKAVQFHKTGIYKAFEVESLGEFYAKLHGSAPTDMHMLMIMGFSQKQRQVIKFLYEGKTAKEIARLLHRSPRSIGVHKGVVYKKLEVNNLYEFRRELRERAWEMDGIEYFPMPG